MKGRNRGAPKGHVTFHRHAHAPRGIWTYEVMMLWNAEENRQRLPHINGGCR
jgi:hypothetical protein